MSLCWFVLRSKPGQVMRSRRELRQQKFRTHLSMTYMRARIAGRAVVVCDLRFSDYLLVEFEYDTDPANLDQSIYAPIFHTRGVAELLCNADGNPEPLRPKEFTDLLMWEELEWDACKARTKLRDDVRPGAKVMITSAGRWKGHKGEVLSVEGQKAKVMAGIFSIWVPLGELDLVVQGGKDNPKRDFAGSVPAEA